MHTIRANMLFKLAFHIAQAARYTSTSALLMRVPCMPVLVSTDRELWIRVIAISMVIAIAFVTVTTDEWVMLAWSDDAKFYLWIGLEGRCGKSLEAR
jgi:hypothetical protein